ncbi:transposase [Paenibacillus sp. Soil522]|uniref:transposase n=1 Tax=Paenibacillus sp. Soil522 TaxID=1736388 RepID=UPI0007145C8E|nr:transposase [Paenibacillus sp. Soil522]KRE47906.1 hypothetical protein ASG81_08310 [Paenibacillus sp. Soil522]
MHSQHSFQSDHAQRFDQAALSKQWQKIVLEESAKLLKQEKAPLTPLQIRVDGETKAYMQLDLDVSPFDNSKTKKEGFSRTYKGVDGYAPFFAYLGQEGYGVNVELRTGSAHSQKEADDFIDQSIRYACTITDVPILARFDAGNDAADTVNTCLYYEQDLLSNGTSEKNHPRNGL